jgi:hypothetical protein
MTDTKPLFRNHLVSSRFPQFSGAAGSVCSAPFVLNTDISTVTANLEAEVRDPWSIASGGVSDAGVANIVPIGIPAEYNRLEIWVAAQADLAADTPPVLSLYGRTHVPPGALDGMPNAYASANYPLITEWWTPLTFVDRAVDRLGSSGNMDEVGAGIPHTAIGNSDGEANSSGSYNMQAVEFKLNYRPVPMLANTASEFVSQYGTDFFCSPSTNVFLDGCDYVLAVVKTAGTGGMLMGRLHG